jgi:hypothetical protein
MELQGDVLISPNSPAPSPRSTSVISVRLNVCPVGWHLNPCVALVQQIVP